jgi:hypothetical protein
MTDPATISAIIMGSISLIGAIGLFFNRLHIKRCIACCCNCECASSNPSSRVNSTSNIKHINNSNTTL